MDPFRKRGRSYIEHNVKIGNESFPAGISG